MNWIKAKNNPPQSSDQYLCIMKTKIGYCIDTVYWSEFTCRWEYIGLPDGPDIEIEDQSAVLYYIEMKDIPLPSELTGCSC